MFTHLDPTPSPRRRTRLSVAAASLLAFSALASLSVCSDDTGSSPDAPTADAAAADDTSAFPVTIEHRFGATEITEEAERVVTVGLTDQDAALAVGVVPVGTYEWFGDLPGAIFPWAEDELGDAEVPTVVADAAGGLNFEAIAALRPDLILAVYSGLDQSDFDQLSAIAPTVAQPDEFVDWGVPWQDHALIIGTALGRPDEAQAAVDEVEAQLDDAREAHPEFEGALGSMATIYDGGLSVYAPQDSRGRFLTSLGFVLPDELAELAGDDFSADVSMERVDLIDGDVVVWLINDLDTDVPQFEANALYSGLAVHLEGRDVFLEIAEPVGAATSFVTVLSVPTLIDGLVPQLATAVDGDPAT